MRLTDFLKEVTYTDVHIYNNDEVVDEWLKLSFQEMNLHSAFLQIAEDLKYYPEYREREAQYFAKDYLIQVEGYTEEEAEEFIKNW